MTKIRVIKRGSRAQESHLSLEQMRRELNAYIPEEMLPLVRNRLDQVFGLGYYLRSNKKTKNRSIPDTLDLLVSHRDVLDPFFRQILISVYAREYESAKSNTLEESALGRAEELMLLDGAALERLSRCFGKAQKIWRENSRQSRLWVLVGNAVLPIEEIPLIPQATQAKPEFQFISNTIFDTWKMLGKPLAREPSPDLIAFAEKIFRLFEKSDGNHNGRSIEVDTIRSRLRKAFPYWELIDSLSQPEIEAS
ncbi:MAG: hypothetical protein WBX25_29100 [Rhodomicrobium sp.]